MAACGWSTGWRADTTTTTTCRARRAPGWSRRTSCRTTRSSTRRTSRWAEPHTAASVSLLINVVERLTGPPPSSRWSPAWPRPTTGSSCGWPTRASSPSCRRAAAATWWGTARRRGRTSCIRRTPPSPAYRWAAPGVWGGGGTHTTFRTPPQLTGSLSSGALEGPQAEEDLQGQEAVPGGPQRRGRQGEPLMTRLLHQQYYSLLLDTGGSFTHSHFYSCITYFHETSLLFVCFMFVDITLIAIWVYFALVSVLLILHLIVIILFIYCMFILFYCFLCWSFNQVLTYFYLYFLILL